MKTLMLLRHGKSDWGSGFDSDHERILAPRGERAARLVGRVMSASKLRPDKVVSSTATRALSTAKLAAEAGEWSCEIDTTRDLYGASVSGALEVLRRQDDGAESILMVGHEPTWSTMASGLIGGGRLAVVTATLVVIDLACKRWADAELGTGELRLFISPRWLEKACG